MKELNKLRLMAGIAIDPSIEITEHKEQITEARQVPSRRTELTAKDAKSMNATIKCVQAAIKHTQQAIKSLDKIPATDFGGEVPSFINELEDLVSMGGSLSMRDYLNKCQDGLREFNRKAEEEEESFVASASKDNFANEKMNETAAEMEDDSQEIEDAMDSEVGGSEEDQIDDDDSLDDEGVKIVKPSDAEGHMDDEMDDDAEMDDMDDEEAPDPIEDEMDDGDPVGDDMEDDVVESVHIYKDAYTDYESDVAKPINASNGKSNKEQIYNAADPKNTKDEGPTQLHTGDEKSPQDQSDGHDLEAKFTVPNTIKASLKSEIANIKAEAKKLGVTNKESSYFYTDMANAFEELLGHLEHGTIHHFKDAQHFAQSLMGPMLHKIPADVWKFLTNGGETRSLKDYMKPVDKKFPITGPRNTIK